MEASTFASFQNEYFAESDTGKLGEPQGLPQNSFNEQELTSTDNFMIYSSWAIVTLM